MNRRDFLRFSLASAGLAVSWRLWAAPSGGTGARFLLVFLRGGYDALSALVPYSEPFYYAARPNIAIPKPVEDDPGTAIKLDGRWGLHPVFEETLLPMFTAGELAFVPFAGPDFLSRSHFQAQDWIEFGQAPDGHPSTASGFLNRLLVSLEKGSAPRQEAVSFTRDLPLVLRGQLKVANSPVSAKKGSRGMDVAHEDLVEAMYAGHTLQDLVHEGLGLRREISQEIMQEMQEASRNAIPASGFALEAGRVGRFMQEHPDYTLGFIDVGGWDSHAGQGGVRGQLSNRLDSLADGLVALKQGMGPMWKESVVVVLSEFGRTFRENGSRGTDHGHGSTLLALGGGLHGGKIVGRQSGLGEADLNEGRDTPVLNEYRPILAGLFQRMYGLDRSALEEIFPAAKPLDLGLV